MINTGWWQRDATLEELQFAVWSIIATIPRPGISTTDLMKRMDATIAHRAALTKALKGVREANPTWVAPMGAIGAFGQPVIGWFDPAAVVSK